MVANLGVGGQQRMALLLAELLKVDYNVSLLVFAESLEYGRFETPQGIRIINLNSGTKKTYFKKLINVIKRVKKTRRIKKNKGIDVTISFGESANIVNVLSDVGDKKISSIRNSYVVRRGTTRIDEITIKKSDFIVFVSKGQMNAYVSYYPQYCSRMKVIYNACDIDRIREMATQCIDFEIKKSFTAVGRLVDVKCFGNLIKAFSIVEKKYPEIMLYIIGEGEKNDELADIIKKNGLEKKVILLGNKDNPFAYVAKSKGFLNSSCSESFSNVVLEALACGVPVVSTDCQFGPREILGGNTEYGLKDRFEIVEWGILTPSFSLDSSNQTNEERIFAEAVIELIENEEEYKRLRDNSYKRCKFFSKNEYKNAWIELLNEITVNL